MSPEQDPPTNTTRQHNPTLLHLRDHEDVKLLDTIDKLRGLGVDKDIPLPQLVVVGEQDAGKTSVLEAISNIHFPTDQGACTRFATEVVLRRAAAPDIRARLLLHDEETDPISKPLLSKDSSIALAFTAALENLKPSTADKIPQLIKEASKAMGLDKSNGFSEHILQLEISGPDQAHLTLIDLPGVFQRSASREDPEVPDMVRQLARRYISMERSIILAVVHANTDYAIQDTLSLVEEVDPEGFEPGSEVSDASSEPGQKASFRLAHSAKP
jgi:GTPase SAR1 family protein